MTNSAVDKIYGLFPGTGSRKITEKLENAGASVISFPRFEAELISSDYSRETFEDIKKIDWIIFPDVFTVDFFLEILRANDVDLFDLDEIRVCALGEVVSDRLRFVQLHADVIPNTIETDNVLSAMQSYIFEGNFSGLKILLPQRFNAADDVAEALKKNGAEVFQLPVYKINPPAQTDISKLKALLKGGAIDEFVFSSPEDFIFLRHLFDEDLPSRILAGIKITAADGLIFQTARENKLKPEGLFQVENIDNV